MNKRVIYLETDCTKEQFDKEIKEVFHDGIRIYALIPNDNDDFLVELADDYEIINAVPNKYDSSKTLDIVGFVDDQVLKYAFEFFERAALIAFVMASTKINFDKDDLDRDTLYSYFEENNIPHMIIGPEGQWLIYYENNVPE